MTSQVTDEDVSMLNDTLPESKMISSTPIEASPNSSASMENISEKVPAKKGRAKGKAAIITDDSYKENLMAEKLKNIKKEKSGKQTNRKRKASSKPVIKSDILLPSNLQPLQPAKRQKKKCQPLTSLENQTDMMPLVTPIEQRAQIVQPTVASLPQNTIFLEVDNATSNSYFNLLPVQNPIPMHNQPYNI